MIYFNTSSVLMKPQICNHVKAAKVSAQHLKEREGSWHKVCILCVRTNFVIWINNTVMRTVRWCENYNWRPLKKNLQERLAAWEKFKDNKVGSRLCKHNFFRKKKDIKQKSQEWAVSLLTHLWGIFRVTECCHSSPHKGTNVVKSKCQIIKVSSGLAWNRVRNVLSFGT